MSEMSRVSVKKDTIKRNPKKEGKIKKRGWFWKVYGHSYKRVSVDDLRGFCGWSFVDRLLEECLATPYYEKPHGLFINTLKKKYEDTDTPVTQIYKEEEKLRTKLRAELQLRDQHIGATAMATGGRISEILMLHANNFTLQKTKNFLHSTTNP